MICPYCNEEITGTYWDVEGDIVCDICFPDYAVEYVSNIAIRGEAE